MSKNAPIEAAPREAINISDKEDRDFVTALARGLSVLSSFQDAEEPLGNQEISERTGLPKSTVSRLTYTLTRLGYLDNAPGTNKYHIGGASVAFATSVFRSFGVKQVAAPILQELAIKSETSVSLGVREHLNMVYVHHYRCNSPFSLNAEPGWRIPIATTAMGRAYLSVCSAPERTTVFEQLQRDNPGDWQRVQKQLDNAVTQYSSQRICSSFGDWHPEVNAIATAFVQYQHAPPIAISCGGPAYKLTKEYLLTVVQPLLLDAAIEIQDALARLN